MLYRFGPDRAAARVRWLTPGALIAGLAWALATAGLSIYTRLGGSLGGGYGAFVGVIIVLLWLFLTAYIIGLGAEINAAAEMQTARDTTTGDPRPLGRRGATVANALPAGVTGPTANRIVAEISRSAGPDAERVTGRRGGHPARVGWSGGHPVGQGGHRTPPRQTRSRHVRQRTRGRGPPGG